MLITAYYFNHHSYTLVPRHVRDDMSWLADAGADAIALAVLEQDLHAAVWNYSLICREAERAGLTVHAVPSRWGGLVAGAPKVPSLFTATHPATWMLDPQGRPYFSNLWGPTSSVHDPATVDFFRTTLEKMLKLWPIQGIIWDEPKAFGHWDFSPLARAKMPPGAGDDWHADQMAAFFQAVSAHAKQVQPEVKVSLFLYSHLKGHVLDAAAGIAALDYFGCDGRPWRLTERPPEEPTDKVLLGQAERFLTAARQHGRGGLILIENHDLPKALNPLMDARLPEILQLGAQHVLFYYYGRNVEDPDENMAIVRKHIRRFAGREG